MEVFKKDSQITILKCLAIFFVVIGHRGGIDLLGEWFPIYSFHIPLWFFISGCLYKTQNENQIVYFIKRKVYHLVIPFFFINSLYGIIAIFLSKKNIIAYGIQNNLRSFLIVPWQGGNQFGLNLASWFVLALFLIEISYVIIRKILSYLAIKNEYILGVFFLVTGTLGVVLAHCGYRTEWWLTLVRVLYGLFFFHMGHLYYSKWKFKDTLNSGIYFSLCFLMSYIMQLLTSNNLYIGVWNADFNRLQVTPILSLLTPIAGIMFWLRVSKLLVRWAEKSKFINYIGSNTWTIMMHHQMIFFIINYIFSKLYINYGWPSDFDINAFRTNAWYGYTLFHNPNSMLIFSILGILIPLSIKFLLQKFLPQNKIGKFIAKSF